MDRTFEELPFVAEMKTKLFDVEDMLEKLIVLNDEKKVRTDVIGGKLFEKLDDMRRDLNTILCAVNSLRNHQTELDGMMDYAEKLLKNPTPTLKCIICQCKCHLGNTQTCYCCYEANEPYDYLKNLPTEALKQLL